MEVNKRIKSDPMLQEPEETEEHKRDNELWEAENQRLRAWV